MQKNVMNRTGERVDRVPPIKLPRMSELMITVSTSEVLYDRKTHCTEQKEGMSNITKPKTEQTI